MRTLLLFLTAASLTAQSAAPLKIGQSSGSISGELWQQEPRANGTNWFKWLVPALAADVSLKVPNALPLTDDECWTAKTTGVSAWLPCTSNAFIQNGNSFGGTAVLGTNDSNILAFETNATTRMQISAAGLVGIGGAASAQLHIKGGGGGQNVFEVDSPTASNSLLMVSNDTVSYIGNYANLPLKFVTDSAVRWGISATGMLYPEVHDTYDIGLTGTRVRGVYAGFGEFWKSGGTASSDYVDTRKFRVRDQTGLTGGWDWQANVTATTTKTFFRDNAGDPALEILRQELSAPANYSNIYTDWLPAKRDTGLGHSTSDSVYPSLGRTGRRWAAIWADDATFTDDVAIGDLLTVTGNAILSGSANTMSGTLAPGFDSLGKIGTTALRYGEVNSYLGNFAGMLTAGAGLAVTGGCTGCSNWTLSGGSVYRPSGAVGIGGASTGSALHIKGGGGGQNIIQVDSPAASNTILMISNDSVSYFGNYANIPLNFVTDSAIRWGISATGMFIPGLDDTYDAGLTGTRIRGVYAKFGEFWKSGSTASSDYVTSRKFNILDQTGGSASWDWQANATATTSKLFWRDNAGDPAFEILRQESSSPANYSNIYTDWLPQKRSTGSGHSVTDTVYPSLGRTGRRWAEIWVDDGTFTDDVAIGDALTVTGSVLMNGATNTMPGTLSPGITGLGKIGTASLEYGEGHFVDLTVSGTCTGCTTVTAPLTLTLGASGYSEPLIVQNSTVGLNGACVVVGAHDGTATMYNAGRLCAKFDTPSFTDELISLQTLTGVGTYGVAQSWKNLDSRFYGDVEVAGNVDMLGSFNYMYGTMAPQTNNSGSIGDASLRYATYYGVAGNFSGAITVGSCTGCTPSFNAHFLPTASATYNIGSAIFKVLDVHTNYVDLYSDLTFNSGATFTGSIIPSANNSYALGSTSFRISTVNTTNINLSGGITTPGGFSGSSTTVTVRNAAGSGTCTLIYDAGIYRGGTC